MYTYIYIYIHTYIYIYIYRVDPINPIVFVPRTPPKLEAMSAAAAKAGEQKENQKIRLPAADT